MKKKIMTATKKKRGPGVGGRPKKPTAGITDAAEYLWAIFDEFKSKDETANNYMREARVLLDVSVDRAMAALRANSVAIFKRPGI